MLSRRRLIGSFLRDLQAPVYCAGDLPVPARAVILYLGTTMQPGLSTYPLLQQRLHPSHLDALARAGARHIELFAARPHFDYADRGSVREIAAWFRANDVTPHLHQPLDMETTFSRHAGPTLNLIAGDKARRIEAMDEIKRALETAEQIPLATAVVHLGLQYEAWSEWALEHALTGVEHLKAFAGPLGVSLLLENVRNEVTTAAHLLEILRVGHFDSVGVCFNVGHAHLAPADRPAGETDGVGPALELLKARVRTVHLSDNDRRGDQHLWPEAAGTEGVDWAAALGGLHGLPAVTPAILEVTHELGDDLEAICRRFAATQDRFRRLEDAGGRFR